MVDTNELVSLLMRVEEEYRALPGLTLTESQMRRLWAIDRDTCILIVDILLLRGVLRETSRHGFARAS